ncbi:MAG: type II toxin-antitoxin system VapC family toxin [Vulcanimicrobiaceae bacterium]
MILVDTSVWIDHLRFGNATLVEMLEEERVLLHPFVIGEIACGNLRNRARVLANLEALPVATSADHEEVVKLVEGHKLWGKGIGWIDAHLLASALVSGCRLWTLDKRLDRAAAIVGCRLRT